MKNGTMKYWQKKIFILCWMAYAVAYFGRVNLSIAISLIEDSLILNKTSLGVVGSAFFWVYAFGQLINGRLGDKFDARKFIFIGLFGSAISNLLFGFSKSLIVMIVLWGINGYFQSMIWGPLMKTINKWFPQGQKSKMALYMFSSVVVGFFFTWGSLGNITPYVGWEIAFWLPSIFLLIYSFFWYLYARNNPEEVGLSLKDVNAYKKDRKQDYSKISSIEIDMYQTDNTKNKDISEKNLNNEKGKLQPISFSKLILNERLYLIVFACIPLGFVRESITLWAPTMLAETFQLSVESTIGVALIIPAFNFLGVIAVRMFITKLQNNEAKLATMFFASAIISCSLFYFYRKSSIGVYIFFLAMCSLSLYGTSSIITSLIPLKYNMTSSVAGFFDFSIYLGAGLSGIVTGFISNNFGWNIVTFVWVVAVVIGCICMFIAEQNMPIFDISTNVADIKEV